VHRRSRALGKTVVKFSVQTKETNFDVPSCLTDGVNLERTNSATCFNPCSFRSVRQTKRSLLSYTLQNLTVVCETLSLNLKKKIPFPVASETSLPSSLDFVWFRFRSRDACDCSCVEKVLIKMPHVWEKGSPILVSYIGAKVSGFDCPEDTSSKLLLYIVTSISGCPASYHSRLDTPSAPLCEPHLAAARLIDHTTLLN
jgi:hypothetical protein